MVEEQLTKCCSKCFITFNIEMFSNRKTAKDGKRSQCKNCDREYVNSNNNYIKNAKKKYYIDNIDKILINKKEYYIKNKDIMNSKNKDNYYLNKEYYLKQKKNIYLDNFLKISEKRKEIYKNLSSIKKEEINKKNREYYSLNRGSILKQKKHYSKTEIFKASSKNTRHKRRAIVKRSDIKTIELLNLQQNAKVCYWCGCSLKNKKTHIDHYIPLSKGGEHTISNLVISCEKCNLSKHAKDPFEFAQSMGRLL